MVIIKKIVIKMRMVEWTDATDQLAASARAGRSSNPLHHHEARILNPGMDGEAIFSWGGAGQKVVRPKVYGAERGG